MVSFRFSRTHGQESTHIVDEKTGAFVKTYEWMPWIIRELVLIEHIFPRPNVVSSHLPYAPLFREPRVEFGFFKVRLTLSCEIESMTAHATSVSAIMGSVQRAEPSGGSLQAIMITWASTRLSIVLGAPRRGSSLRTSKMCACSLLPYFFRTWWTVARDIPNNWMISASFFPSSANTSRRARLIALADLLPRDTNAWSSLHSWALRATGCFCFGISDSFWSQDTMMAFYVPK